MKLDIIIPQYNETEELIGHLLSSINNQIGIDLTKVVTVTIVNDHSNTKLNTNFLNSFLFKVNYIETPVNGGAGRARQYGIDNTSGDYILFCDADDRLYSSTVLLEICNQIRLLEVKQKSWSYIWTYFYEEFRKDKAFDLIPHDQPAAIWMHGKVWNRKFLQQNDIRFHETLRTFEDTYFGKVVSMLSSADQIYCVPKYSYLWMRNPLSVTSNWNHDGKGYMYWNNHDYITCGLSTAEKLYKHIECTPKWKESLLINFYFTFFIINSKDFADTDNELTKIKIIELENFINELYLKYNHTLKDITDNFKVKVFKSTKITSLNKLDVCCERFSWSEWLRHLDEVYGTDMSEKLKLPY